MFSPLPLKEVHPGAMPSQQRFEEWLSLPGNEIFAELAIQKNLPGMNARNYNVGVPLTPDTKPASPAGPGEVETDNARAGINPNPLPNYPPTYARQWHAPVSRLREQNPGVEIMAWPHMVITVQSNAVDVVRRIPVPPQAKMVIFGGTGGNPGTLLVSKTRFVLPLTAITGDVDNYLAASVGPMVCPWDRWFDCEAENEFFLGFTVAGAIISAAFWTGQGPRTI